MGRDKFSSAVTAAGWPVQYIPTKLEFQGPGVTDETHNQDCHWQEETGARSDETLPGNSRISRLARSRKSRTFMESKVELVGPNYNRDLVFAGAANNDCPWSMRGVSLA